jgi:hypothetical protein
MNIFQKKKIIAISNHLQQQQQKNKEKDAFLLEAHSLCNRRQLSQK